MSKVLCLSLSSDDPLHDPGAVASLNAQSLIVTFGSEILILALPVFPIAFHQTYVEFHVNVQWPKSATFMLVKCDFEYCNTILISKARPLSLMTDRSHWTLA